jgi:hypothetical protein
MNLMENETLIDHGKADGINYLASEPTTVTELDQNKKASIR